MASYIYHLDQVSQISCGGPTHHRQPPADGQLHIPPGPGQSDHRPITDSPLLMASYIYHLDQVSQISCGGPTHHRQPPAAADGQLHIPPGPGQSDHRPITDSPLLMVSYIYHLDQVSQITDPSQTAPC